MNQEKNIKKFPVKEGKNTSATNGKYNSRDARKISSRTDKLTPGHSEPLHKMGNSDIIVPKTTQDIHVGPYSIVKEAIRLDGIKRSDVINSNDMCKTCEIEKKGKNISGRFRKIKNNWTIKRCFLSGILIIFMEIILLTILHCTKPSEHYIDHINPLYIKILHNNLESFMPRKNWTVERWDDTDCTYECPKIKSKLRLIVLPLNSFHCHNNVKTKFHDFGEFVECQRYVNNQSEHEDQFRDIYYNYILFSSPKQIYEGRPHTCPFDEPFLDDNHVDMITVGIEYCFPGRSKVNSLLSLKLTDKISDLISNLKQKGFLTRDYVLDFPDICNNSYILERIKRLHDVSNITFYKHELYKELNVSTKVDPTLFSKLLLLPKDTSQNDTETNPAVRIQFPFSANKSITNSNISLTILDKITIRFSLINVYESPVHIFNEADLWKSTETFLQKYKAGINLYGDKVLGSIFDPSIGNYFVFPDDRVTYGHIPENFSTSENEKGNAVNIFFMYYGDDISEWVGIDENIFLWFTHVFESIRDDVSKRVKYSQVDYQIICGSDVGSVYYNSLPDIYEYFPDISVSYIQFQYGYKFIPVRSC